MNPAANPALGALDPELEARLTRFAAARQGVPLQLVHEAVAQYLDREETRQTVRHAAVAAWEEFETTSQHVTGNEVMAWLERWGDDDKLPAPACHK